jgi:RNA recognition motif-containing protein
MEAGVRNPQRLFVGGLPENIKDDDIRDRFSTFGAIKDLEVITNEEGNETKKKLFK